MSLKRLGKSLLGKALRCVPVRTAEGLVDALERRIGIGSGAGVKKSGERVAFEALVQLFDDRLVVFDVGAAHGNYSAAALKRFGRQRESEIHCFEPSQVTFDKLTAKLGKRANVKLNRFALADKPGTAVLFMEREESGLASLTERELDYLGYEHGKFREEVELRTLADYCRETGIERIHLLKLDVEGHELDVLAGGRSLLEEGKIDLVQFELSGANVDTRTYLRDFFKLFGAHGFDIYRILPGRKLLALPSYRELDEKLRAANFLAIRQALDAPARCGKLIV